MRNLLILAKWLAAQAEIDVVEYSGSTACIGLLNGRKVIRIPRHWNYTNDPEATELLEGVIDHEALGHGRCTDLEGRKKAQEAGLIKFNSYSSSIQNILEDVFIERQAIAVYPGVQRNFSRTVAILVKREFFGSVDKFQEAAAPQLLLAGLLNILRAKLIPGQADALKENVDALEALLPNALGQLWSDVLDVAVEVEHSTSTHDNILLTVRIMNLINAAAEKSQQKEDSKSEAEPDPSANSDDQEGEAAKAIIAALDDDQPSTEISEALSAAIQASAVTYRQAEMQSSNATEKVSPEALRVASQVKRIGDDLQDALLTETREEKSIKLVGKRLHSRVLSRVRQGNARVFRQRKTSQGLSTAVLFLCDMSHSMITPLVDKVSRLDAVVGLSYGLGDILDEFEIPFQINAYSCSYGTLKTFDQDWTLIRKQAERPSIPGMTYTGMAAQKALGDLVVRHEDRKLLVLMTDGDTPDLELLKSCYAEAQMMGIEIASLMIGPLIPSVSDLAATFGFKAISINSSSGLGQFAVDRILEAI